MLNDPATTDDCDTIALHTFATAFLVLFSAIATVDPSRLYLLLIPGSFLFAAHGVGLFVEWAAPACIPSLPLHRPMLTLTVRLSVGISLLGFATTILGLVGLYRFAVLLIPPTLTWSLLHIVRATSRPQQFRPRLASLAGGLTIGTVWAIVWLWGTIPATFYDELAYHLPIAQYALRTGEIPAFPWSFLTYMPHLSDLLLGWGLAFNDDIGARAMHLALWFAIWIAGWAHIGTLIAPEKRPWIGCLIGGVLASSPMVLFLGALPFSETALTYAVLASASLITLPATSAFWFPLGLVWGFTLSVKLSGLSWVIAGAIAAMVVGWPLRSIIRAGLAALVIALPWWGRSWWLTGNPIYPLGYRWFGGRYWTDASQARLEGDLPSYAASFDIHALLRLPYDMIMVPERFGSASECGPLAVAATCLLLCLPLWALAWDVKPDTRKQCYAAGLFVLLTALSWIATSTTTRFFAPALMIGLMTLVALLTKAPKVVLILSSVILMALGAWGSSRFLSMHSLVFSSEKVALGQEPPAQFAARTLDHYEAAKYVQTHLPPDANLLFIGESRPFHFNRPSLAPYPFHEHPLTRWLQEEASPEQLRNRLRHEGFTHVVLNTHEFTRLHDTYHVLAFTGPEASLYDQRLKDLPGTLTTLFSKHRVFVFEIPHSP